MTKAKKGRSLNQALIIFIKNPVLGKVKTRLAKSVGDEKALLIYKELLAHTRHTALRVNASRQLYYHEEIREDEWTEDDFVKRLQKNGDLGHKMKSAFETVLSSYASAIIIGSDCAQLNSDIISGAFKALTYHDLVIGPTLDGGYYLLGMNHLHHSLFDGIKWSTDTVYSDTLAKAAELQLTVAKLETLSDIDHIEDWNQYGL